MLLALECARQAEAHGDVPVGAVVALANGTVIGRGANCVELHNNPAAHAEIIALGQAARKLGTPRLDGAFLISTLEPCLMCASAIAHARIAGLVFGASDPRAGAIHSAADLEDLPLGGRSYWHMGGILAHDCALLLNAFFDRLRQQTPFPSLGQKQEPSRRSEGIRG